MPANRCSAFASLALGSLLFAGACVDLTLPKNLQSGGGGQGGTISGTTSSATIPGTGGAGGTAAGGASGATAGGAGGETTGGTGGQATGGADGATTGGAGGTTAGGAGGVATGGAGGVRTGGTAAGGRTATGGSTSPGDGGVTPDLRAPNEVATPVEVAPPPDAAIDKPAVPDVAQIPDVAPDVAQIPDVAQVNDVAPDVAQIPDVAPDVAQVPDVPADTTTVTPGLVLYYNCEQANGTVLPDMSGNGNDGTLMGTISIAPVAGRAGNALVLTGGATSGGYVVMPTGILATSSEMTIATWFKINSTTAPYQRIFDIGSSPTISSMFLTPTYGTGGNLHFTIRFTLSDGGVNRDDIDGTAIAAGQWYHAAVVIDTSGNGRLYLDGSQVGPTTALKFRPISLGSTPNDWIGRSEFVANPYFDGAIDEFRIYSRALSAAEISALHTGH